MLGDAKSDKIASVPTFGDIGTKVDTVEVFVSARFLDLFSKNLYRTPNKAFEELVANSWDAGATTVYVKVPLNLKSPGAAVWLLDNGESMDSDGLKQLWRIADSKKPGRREGRPQIGKFGIGKLATYLLAHRLTYVCKAADGKIRYVEMDYDAMDPGGGVGPATGLNLLSSKEAIKRDLIQISEAELETLLSRLEDGDQILDLVTNGVPRRKSDDPYIDEFGHTDEPVELKSGTWTLAIMADMKELGQTMQVGWIRYLLRTALPLGQTMSIVFNDELLKSPHIDIPVVEEMVLGQDFPIAEFKYAPDPSDAATTVTKKISVGDNPPHITIEGVTGVLTGTARRYARSISGKKSDALERSNGYFVNVLGRVVNSEDPYFGLDDLSHSVWSEFRMCVRADGLNHSIGINREQLNETEELRIFRAFLKAVFNRARQSVDSPANSRWPSAGEAIVKSWGAIPLQSFRRSLRHFDSHGSFPDTIILGDEDPETVSEEIQKWERDAAADPGSVISAVEFRGLGGTAHIFAYDLLKREIVVNLDHPFVRMHGRFKPEKDLLGGIAVAETLASARLTDIGVPEELISDFEDYRDQLYRVVASIQRDSGIAIAEHLVRVTDDDDALEIIVGEALEFIGFDVEPMRGTGEPEGVATSPVPHSRLNAERPYLFTYDAKSTLHKAVKTKNVGVATLQQHRKDTGADYTLVVGPNFEKGQLTDLCQEAGVTPMRAADLAKLLMLAAGTGPLNLEHFETVFDNNDADDVSAWVTELVQKTLSNHRVNLSDVVDAIESLDNVGGVPIGADSVARELKRAGKVPQKFTRNDVLDIFRGLYVLVPSLVNVVNTDIYLGTSTEKFREAIIRQVSIVPPEFRFALNDLTA